MKQGIGMFLMNIAVACYLFCAGILGFNNRWFDSSEIRKAVIGLLGRGDATNVVVIILAVFAIAAGFYSFKAFQYQSSFTDGFDFDGSCCCLACIDLNDGYYSRTSKLWRRQFYRLAAAV